MSYNSILIYIIIRKCFLFTYFYFSIYTVTNLICVLILKFLFKNMAISTVRHTVPKIFMGSIFMAISTVQKITWVHVLTRSKKLSFYVPTKWNNMGTCTVQYILMQYYHGPNGFTWVRTRSKTLSYILTRAITCSLSCYLNLLTVSNIQKS